MWSSICYRPWLLRTCSPVFSVNCPANAWICGWKGIECRKPGAPYTLVRLYPVNIRSFLFANIRESGCALFTILPCKPAITVEEIGRGKLCLLLHFPFPLYKCSWTVKVEKTDHYPWNPDAPLSEYVVAFFIGSIWSTLDDLVLHC